MHLLSQIDQLVITDRPAGIPRHAQGLIQYHSAKYGTEFDTIGLYNLSSMVPNSFQDQLEIQKRKDKISKNTSLCFFDETTLAQAFEVFPVIYVDMVLSRNPEQESFILDCWKNRVRRNNLMVSLMPVTALRETSPAEWQSAKKDGCGILLGEEIQAQANILRASNQYLRTQAQELVAQITNARLKGTALAAPETMQLYPSQPALLF